ncbi:MAG TPA: extracellular solute-binding protein [Candidatus Limnocylindrales bacterium]|jgi:multiple sugar transport system substrate-binding protein
MAKGRFYRGAGLAASFALVAAACSTPASVAPPTTAPQSAAPASAAPASAATASGSASGTAQNFSGVTVNVLTFVGPQIAEPLQRRAPDFNKLTGANVQVTTVPFSDLYQKILTDSATGTNSYNAYVFDPQWMGDFVSPGYLTDLTDKVNSDTALQWNDIAPFFRDFSATYKGKVYTLPLDGDFLMVYYRSDLLQKDGLQPPKTWDDYLTIAKTYNGKDLNGDGKPDYGSCISKKRGAQAYWFIYAVASAYIQSQGTNQGVFFDTTNMKPLVNNEAFAKALDIYKATGAYAPADELNDDVGNTRTLFTGGRCALSIDWGDIGTLALDPKTSVVQDKVGAEFLPGSTQVLDRASGKLVACSATTCPDAVSGVNHAPFAAFGGWSGAVNNADPQNVKDAAYAFLSYMSQPAQSAVDVTLGKTGFNPYRTSQFTNLDAWKAVGMSDAAANLYLGGIKDSLNSPNLVLDMRVPKTQQYEQVVLDQAIAQFLAGEITRDAAMKQIEDGWNQITDTEGRDKQLAAYAASLGVKK